MVGATSAPMQPNAQDQSFSAYVRQARRESGLSLSQVAERAGIGRATIHRWERGLHLAWLPELERFIEATKARPALSEAMVRAVNRPRTVEHVEASSGVRMGLNAILRTMRLRAGLTIAETASQLGISVSLVRQWERGDCWPSGERLHSLCYLCRAAPEELFALLPGPLVPQDAGSDLLETAEDNMASGLYPFPTIAADRLLDLKFVYLETRLMERIRGGASRDRDLATLGRLRAFYAQSLQLWARHSEAIQISCRALAAIPSSGAIEPMVRAQIVRAQCFSDLRKFDAKQVAELTGLADLIGQKSSRVHFSYQPWIWATVAELLTRAGRVRAALEALDRAGEIELMHEGRTAELCRRRAKLLNIQERSWEAESAALEGIEIASSAGVGPTLPRLWMEVATARKALHRDRASVEALDVARALASRHRIDFLLPVLARHGS